MAEVDLARDGGNVYMGIDETRAQIFTVKFNYFGIWWYVNLTISRNTNDVPSGDVYRGIVDNVPFDWVDYICFCE
jgi:hypothetical protein